MPTYDLGHAEVELQRWLVSQKPPPEYMERHLIRGEDPEAEERWQAALSALLPPKRDSFMKLASGFRIAEGFSARLLNTVVYEREVIELAETRNRLSVFLQAEIAGLTALDLPKALDRLSYLGLELLECQMWDISAISPLVMRSNFLQLTKLCRKALELSIQAGDHLTLSRAAYNLGRGLQVTGSADEAVSCFHLAFSAGEAHAKQNGWVDVAWWTRRFDILHRIVEIFAKDLNSALGVETYAPLLKGRIPARSPLTIGIPEYDSHNASSNRGVLPVIGIKTNVDKIATELDPSVALISYLNGTRYTYLTLVQEGAPVVTLFDPDLEHLGGWDVFFRPSIVEFRASVHGIPDDIIGSAVRLDLGAFEEDVLEQSADSSGTGLRWLVRKDFIEIRPTNASWVTKRIRIDEILHSSMIWQDKLFELLIEPVLPQLSSAINHLVISPDGGLNLLPFHLLRSSDTLVQDMFSVSYVSDLDALKRIMEFPLRSVQALQILVIGDATGTLPGAIRERQDLQQLFEGRATCLDSRQVNVERIAEEAASADIIHFCGHAYFDSANLDRSGLLLDNGLWMTIAQIESLPIKAGATVFLSACETARIHIEPLAHSTSSLQQAFMSAGATTVICSLWKVHDVSTALLVRSFYGYYIRAGESRVRSLHRAMEWLRTATLNQITTEVSEVELPNNNAVPFASPYFWAPFMLYGDWR